MSHPFSRVARATTTVLVTASLALAGCSFGGSAGKTSLTFFSWDNEAAMAPVIDAFEAEHPDIDVQLTTAPPVTEYVSTLQTRLLSGTAADVFILAAENKSSIIDGGYALDLNNESFMEPIADLNKKTYSSDEGTFGMSVASWGGGIVVNQDLLDKAGIKEFPTTWDGFLDLCQKLKDSGVEPFYDNFQEIPMTLNALLGGQFKGDATVDSNIFAGKSSFEEHWTPSLENFDQLFERGLVKKNVIGLSGDQIVDEFAAGRVAMLATGPWNVSRIRTSAPDMKFTFYPFPPAAGESYLAGAASPGYAINAKSKNVTQAKEFLSFLSSKTGVSLYNKSTNAITTTSNFEPTLDSSLDPIAPRIRDGKVYLAQISWPAHQDALTAEAIARIQEMGLGKQTPREVASALDAKLAGVK